MGKKEDFIEQLGESYAYIESYINGKLELFKLQAAEQSARGISKLTLVLVMVLLLNFTVFCLLLAAGFGLAKLVGSTWLAFLLLALFFLLLAVIIYRFRQYLLLNPSIRMVIKEFYQDEQNPS